MPKIQKIYVGTNLVRPAKTRWNYTPTSNTLVYLPLIDGVTNYGNLSVTFTQVGGNFNDGVFNATDYGDYIYTGGNAYSTYSSYTFMCWVNYPFLDNSYAGFIFALNNYGNGDNGNISVYPGRVERYSGSVRNITYTAKSINERHHYAIVGSSGILYVDGVETGTNSNSVSAKPRHFGINTQRDTGGFGYPGTKYSDFIFEDKVRTAQEVLDYYNNSKGNYGL